MSVIPIIIPAYEPDDRMTELLNTLSDNNLSPIIIVNDGSGSQFDYLYTQAEQLNATVLKHDVNRGKGAALKTAFSYCLNNIPDMLGCVTADSDGQHTVKDICSCMDNLSSNPEALILGVRDFSGEGIPAKSQFGNNLTRKIFRKLYGKDISDTQTGLRGIPASFMKTLLDVSGDRFEYETRMLVSAIDCKRNIIEIPIDTIYDSKENHSTHFRPVADSIRIYQIFGLSLIKQIFKKVK